MSSVVCLSVTRVYCDKLAAVRIMQFSQKISPILVSSPAKFDDKIRRGPSIWGLKVEWGGFQLCDIISRKQCEIELR